MQGPVDPLSCYCLLFFVLLLIWNFRRRIRRIRDRGVAEESLRDLLVATAIAAFLLAQVASEVHYWIRGPLRPPPPPPADASVPANQ